VHLDLPARFVMTGARPRAAHNHVPAIGRALNVLVVEDNLTNQIIAAGMLKRLGHHPVRWAMAPWPWPW
jgi:hypothetical protein